MIKKAVIISYKERPIFVCDNKEFRTYEDFASVSKTAEKNMVSLISMMENDKEEMNRRLSSLELRCKVLEAQIKYDHGEITKEEYDELCGLNN